MIDCDWIIFERTGRWAVALRTALTRMAASPPSKRTLHEVRSWNELNSRLQDRPGAVALLEVRRANLAEALTWLADAGASYSSARCVALLDSAEFDHEIRDYVAAALTSAGAVEIEYSPRHLQRVLEIGLQHAELHGHNLAELAGALTLAEWARTCLPWQSL